MSPFGCPDRAGDRRPPTLSSRSSLEKPDSRLLAFADSRTLRGITDDRQFQRYTSRFQLEVSATQGSESRGRLFSEDCQTHNDRTRRPAAKK